MNYKIDVNIADDHVMLTEGLVEALNAHEKIHVSRTFSTLAQCRQTLSVRTPDVLMLDISMPDGSGTDFCQEVIANYPQVKVIAISSHDEYSIIRKMMGSGAHGYVLKNVSIEVLARAIISVYHGEQYVCEEVRSIIDKGSTEQVFLTEVEHRILRLLCDGLTNIQIADRICLSTETVNWYRKRLLSKFGVKNTVALVTMVLRQGLL